ncbi:MAG: GTPase Era [Bacteroidales bacterium]|jgi:GTP-binding protein Era|nr:GTPase Era [Bacteroidales bacterium]
MDTQQHKAGFVSILGNPNVGKSTLMNALTGERLSIITSKAQTTRHRIMGIVNGEQFQIVYSDTPGLLTPNYKMQEYMMQYVESALRDSDILLYLIECGETNYNEKIINHVVKSKIPVILIINKIDLVTKEVITVSQQHWKTVLQPLKTCCVSALHGTNIDGIIKDIVDLLPVSPPYFSKDELTDRPMRFFVSEIIREKILLQFKKEIPYSVEIEITEYKEEKQITRISANVFVERDSQKAIILGHKGAAIKELGTNARLSIEEFIAQKVYLSLSVKVQKNWRNNDLHLRRFGYGI